MNEAGCLSQVVLTQEDVRWTHPRQYDQGQIRNHKINMKLLTGVGDVTGKITDFKNAQIKENTGEPTSYMYDNSVAEQNVGKYLELKPYEFVLDLCGVNRQLHRQQGLHGCNGQLSTRNLPPDSKRI